MVDKTLPGLDAVVTPVATDIFLTRQAADTEDRSYTRDQLYALLSGEHLILPQVNEAATPTLAFGDGDTGFYEQTDDLLSVATAGSRRFFWQNEVFGGDNATGPALLNEASGFANPNILPRRNDTDTGIGGSGADQVSIIVGGIGGTIWQEVNSGMTVQNAVIENITASTTQTQGQQTLVSSYNEVGTVANDNDVVTLPTARAGQHCLIINNGANTLQIFPLTGDDLGEGVNNSTTLAAGESAYFWCWDITTWMRIAVSIDWNGTQLTLPQVDDATTPTLTFGDGDSGLYESSDDVIAVSIAGVREWSFFTGGFQGNVGGGARISNVVTSATVPTLIPFNTDTDTGIGSSGADTVSLIAGGLEMVRLVETGVAATDQVRVALTISGAAGTPALAFGDGDTGFWENIDDVLNCGVAGQRIFVLTNTPTRQLAMDDAAGPALVSSGSSLTVPNIRPNKADTDSGFSSNGADTLVSIVGGVTAVELTELNSGIVQAPQATLGITAFAGGGQGSATPLTSSYNVITTVATAGDSVRLPDTFKINSIVVIRNNDSTDACDVFPASGDDLGAGVDTAASLAAGASITYIATVADSTWTILQ